MATFGDVLRRFESLGGLEYNEVVDSFNEKNYEAARLNASQLQDSKDADGKSPNWFGYSTEWKDHKRQLTGLASVITRLTNYDTGASYFTLNEQVVGDKIIFSSGTSYADQINGRMNGKAFGLTDENKAIFINDFVKPDFVQRIKAFLEL